jgi:magnesium transporter
MKKKPRKKSKWMSGKKKGLPPGSLVYVGNRENQKLACQILDYNTSEFHEHSFNDPEKCLSFKDSESVTWINIIGLSDTEKISKIAKHYGLHDLLVEDILNTTSRPKIEQTEDYIFAILKMAWHEGDILHFEHITVVLGSNWVLTFQELSGDVFNTIRERIKIPSSKIRKSNADHLYYALLDCIVDNYFVVLEHVGDKLEDFEDELVDHAGHESFLKLQSYRKELIRLRRSVYPLREVISTLSKTEHQLISSSNDRYFRDLYDHTIQVIETVETFRDLMTTMFDIYMSGVSNRMNNIMKVLTIIATIFIPLTFIVGVYGMNFENMPELQWKYGYFLVLGFMATLAFGMLWMFKKKGWL